MKAIKRKNGTHDTFKAKRKSIIIEIDKPVRIPDTDIILTKGDKIEVLHEGVEQSISITNDCTKGTLSVYENDDGGQFVSGNIEIFNCPSGGKITADVVKKVLDSVVSGLKLQAPEFELVSEKRNNNNRSVKESIRGDYISFDYAGHSWLWPVEVDKYGDIELSLNTISSEDDSSVVLSADDVIELTDEYIYFDDGTNVPYTLVNL